MGNRKHDIERYLKGELSPGEMHALEKEALNDPFLAEALEGVEQAGRDNFLFDLHQLNRSVHDRTRKRKSRTLTMWGWPTGIAATVLLIAVSGYLVVSLLREQEAQRQAMNTEAALEEDSIKHTDSLSVGSGAIAQTEAIKEETPIRTETPPAHADQSVVEEKPAEVRSEEKPIDEEIDIKKDLIAAKEAEEEWVRQTEAAREAQAIADLQESEAKQELNATSELKKQTDRPELAGAPDRRAETADAPSRAPSASGALDAASIQVRGRVFSDDGEGLPGVNVLVKGENSGTVTDAMGNYQISVPAPDTKLLFAFIGFKTEEVAVSGKSEVNVELTEDVSSLSEVVIVSGYGSVNDIPANETFRAAEPQTGKSDFKNYLEHGVRYPEEAIKNKTEGKVTVSFTVNPSGQLSGFQVLKGIGSGCDEELIRAIREGPGWRPAKKGEQAVPDKVKVRYRFELPK